MKIICPECQTEYALDDSIKNRKSFKMRCSKCSHAFFINPQQMNEQDPPAPTPPDTRPLNAEATQLKIKSRYTQIRLSNGRVYDIENAHDIETWINEGRVSIDDEILSSDGHWARVGECNDLLKFFNHGIDLPEPTGFTAKDASPPIYEKTQIAADHVLDSKPTPPASHSFRFDHTLKHEREPLASMRKTDDSADINPDVHPIDRPSYTPPGEGTYIIAKKKVTRQKSKTRFIRLAIIGLFGVAIGIWAVPQLLRKISPSSTSITQKPPASVPATTKAPVAPRITPQTASVPISNIHYAKAMALIPLDIPGAYNLSIEELSIALSETKNTAIVKDILFTRALLSYRTADMNLKAQVLEDIAGLLMENEMGKAIVLPALILSLLNKNTVSQTDRAHIEPYLGSLTSDTPDTFIIQSVYLEKTGKTAEALHVLEIFNQKFPAFLFALRESSTLSGGNKTSNAELTKRQASAIQTVSAQYPELEETLTAMLSKPPIVLAKPETRSSPVRNAPTPTARVQQTVPINDAHNQAVIRFKKAQQLVKAAEMSKAVQEYLAAIKLSPKFAEAYKQLGLLYYELGNLDDAKAMLKTYLKLNPNDPQKGDINTILAE